MANLARRKPQTEIVILGVRWLDAAFLPKPEDNPAISFSEVQTMRTILFVAIGALLLAVVPRISNAQVDPKWKIHDMDRPVPALDDPGTSSTQDSPGRPPADAVVLFDGKDLSKWAHKDGSAAKWKVENGYFEVVPKTGYIYTREAFGDCQLHVEFAEPVPAKGESQDRGNSGVFLQGLYETQVLDSYQSKTYADGQAAAIYGQYPPLVNASRPPGQWQTYDIVFHGPRFASGAKQLSVFIKTRPVEDDVVGLPLAGRTRSVHQWRVLAIDRASLAVRIGLALVRVQDLSLVESLQEDAAVSAVLVLALCGKGLGKLHVQLAIAKSFARVDVPRLWHDFEITVLHFPLRRAAVLVRPFGKILAVEKNYCIRRRTPRRILRAGCPGIDHRRYWPTGIVNFPSCVDLRVTDCRYSCQQQSAARSKENIFHCS